MILDITYTCVTALVSFTRAQIVFKVIQRDSNNPVDSAPGPEGCWMLHACKSLGSPSFPLSRSSSQGLHSCISYFVYSTSTSSSDHSKISLAGSRSTRWSSTTRVHRSIRPVAFAHTHTPYCQLQLALQALWRLPSSLPWLHVTDLHKSAFQWLPCIITSWGRICTIRFSYRYRAYMW